MARKHLDIRDRKYHLKIYHNVFTGTELVDVFINNGITDKRSHVPCLVELCGLRDIYTMFMTITQFSDRDSSTAFTKMKTILLSWILISGPERESLAFQKAMETYERGAWHTMANSPHTAHTSIIFDASILEDNCL